MFKPRHDELHRFLEWRRRTRFIRHYGGPIMAVTLFGACLCFVWRASSNHSPADSTRPVETQQMHARDPFLQASQSATTISGRMR